MKKLLDFSDRYLKSCSWREISLLKICVCASGVLLGISIPERRKKASALVAALVFVATYVPLMSRFLCSMHSDDVKSCE